MTRLSKKQSNMMKYNIDHLKCLNTTEVNPVKFLKSVRQINPLNITYSTNIYIIYALADFVAPNELILNYVNCIN